MKNPLFTLVLCSLTCIVTAAPPKPPNVSDTQITTLANLIKLDIAGRIIEDFPKYSSTILWDVDIQQAGLRIFGCNQNKQGNLKKCDSKSPSLVTAILVYAQSLERTNGYGKTEGFVIGNIDGAEGYFVKEAAVIYSHDGEDKEMDQSRKNLWYIMSKGEVVKALERACDETVIPLRQQAVNERTKHNGEQLRQVGERIKTISGIDFGK